MSLLLGLELNDREAILTQVDRRGAIGSVLREPLPFPCTESAWRPAEAYYRSVLRLLARASQSGLPGARVAGVGLAGSHGLVLLDREFVPLTLADLPGVEEMARSASVAEFLAWLSSTAPALAKRVGVALSLVDFVRFRLSGALATHVAFALHSGLAVHSAPGFWDRAALDASGIAPGTLPPIFTPECPVSVVSEELTRQSGISAGVWVNAGSDPLSARLLCAAGGSAEFAVLWVADGHATLWEKVEEPARATLPVAGQSAWFAPVAHADIAQITGILQRARSRKVVVDAPTGAEQVLRALEQVDHASCELWIAHDFQNESAATALQMGIGLGWWRDLRSLVRKHRPPLRYADWRRRLQDAGGSIGDASAAEGRSA